MKFPNGNYYVEVKDKRYLIHPTENIILRQRNPQQSVRTQYQVQTNTQIRQNQKDFKNDNDELIVKSIWKRINQLFNNEKLIYLNALFVKEIIG